MVPELPRSSALSLQSFRVQIPACERVVYLNSGFAGPMPTRVVEAIQARLREESEEGPTSPAVTAHGEEIVRETRTAMAALLQVSRDEVCLTENTTEGINHIVGGMSWTAGDEVITFAHEHPSVLLPALFLERRFGVRPIILPLAPDDAHDAILARVEAALTPRARLVMLSHVQNTSGLRMPVAAIAALVRAHGSRLLVDGAQAAGQLALDLHTLDVDYYALPGHKWLLGPRGTGALFVRRELIPTLEPHAISMMVGQYVAADARLEVTTDSIRKFELSTASAALRAGLWAAIQLAQEAGPAAIEAHNGALAAYAKTSLGTIPGVRVLTSADPTASVGLVTFRIDGLDAQAAADALWNAQRIVARAMEPLQSVRISLHAFNTEAEVDLLLDTVRRLR